MRNLLETKERVVSANKRWVEMKEEKNSKCICIGSEIESALQCLINILWFGLRCTSGRLTTRGLVPAPGTYLSSLSV